MALGFIAFSIGNEFRLAELKKTGRQATIVAIVQALAATVLVDVSLIAMYYIFDLVTAGMPKFLSARVSISPRNIAKPSINNNVAVSEI